MSLESSLSRIHPLVVISILNHHAHCKKSRSVGLLFGLTNTSESSSSIDESATFSLLEITNSFPLEIDDSFNLNEKDVDALILMHQRANPKEKCVGWYTTGSSLDSVTQGLVVSFAKHLSNPVFLLIDPFASPIFSDPNIDLKTLSSSDSSGVSIKAYVSQSLQLTVPTTSSSDTVSVTSSVAPYDKITLGTQFIQVRWEFKASESERIGVSALMNNSVSSSQGIKSLEPTIKTLSSLIDSVSQYVSRVVSGEESNPSHEVGRLLMDVVASLPRQDIEVLKSELEKNVQDSLMVSHLMTMLKTQLGMMEKINAIAWN